MGKGVAGSQGSSGERGGTPAKARVSGVREATRGQMGSRKVITDEARKRGNRV